MSNDDGTWNTSSSSEEEPPPASKPHKRKLKELSPPPASKPQKKPRNNRQTPWSVELDTHANQQVVVHDEYDDAMCVWGFLRIHIESTQQFQSNKVIPEAVKQLIMNFLGKYCLFMKMINDSEQEQIELKIHSHKGHHDEQWTQQYIPENMLQSNDDHYYGTCAKNDWIVFSLQNNHMYYPTKVQVDGSLKNFGLKIGNIDSNEWIDLNQQIFTTLRPSLRSVEMQSFDLDIKKNKNEDTIVSKWKSIKKKQFKHLKLEILDGHGFCYIGITEFKLFGVRV